MPTPEELKRLRWRAHHRGTREADMMLGGFFDTHHRGWSDENCDWFTALLDEQDVDIMAWAIGTATPPAKYLGKMMRALQSLDYFKVAR